MSPRDRIEKLGLARTALTDRRKAIDERRVEIKRRFSERTNPHEHKNLQREYVALGLEAQALQAKLSKLKDEGRLIGKDIQDGRHKDPAFNQLRAETLFAIAHSAHNFLFGRGLDGDEPELAVALEDALDRLEELCPGWRVNS